MRICNWDVESCATVDLTVVGAYVYWAHPDTELLCVNYTFDKGKTPVRRWRVWLGEPMPKDLADALDDPECLFEGWNANFERLACRHGLRREIPIERFRCTMARARAMALPGKLELCAKALRMPTQKADSGIMMKWCKPLPDGTWAEDPAEYELLLDYCDVDVMTEVGIGEVIRDLTAEEWRDYHLNEKVNDRGIPVDIDLAIAAQHYARDELEDIKARLTVITKGVVTSPKQFQRIKEWLLKWLPPELQEYMEPDPVTGKVSFDGPTREELLAEENEDVLVGDVREFVELVHDGGRASTSKFAAMQSRAGNDGRVRGAYVFNGAGQTGRYSSTGLQVHNFIRAGLTNLEFVVEDVLKRVPKDALIDIASYNEDGTFVFDKSKGGPIEKPYNVLTILSRLLRPSIVAEDGKKLVWGDWSSIEAVVNPWLSKENSASELLDYFASGKDLYLRQAVMTYGLASEDQVTASQRQAGGKVPVLSFGFGGGAGAYLRMARAYGVAADHEFADMQKIKWRQSNPWAERFWRALEIAAYNAVRAPDTVFFAGRVAYMCAQSILWCLLPSGRMLAYPFPMIETIEGRFGPQDMVTCIKGSFHPKKDSNYWPRMKLWGGIQCLGPHTQVLTRKGWVYIIDIGDEPVWDGVEFVAHKGVAYKGWKRVAQLDGVWLTADHRVLTEEGWREASQCQGLRRAPCGLPDDGSRHRDDRQASHLAGALRLRGYGAWPREGADPWQHEVMRMQKRYNAHPLQGDAWAVPTSSLRRLALDEGALSSADASGVEKLRRAWHHGLQAVAEGVQVLLGRHAARLSSWLGTRSPGQHARLHAEELSLDYQTHQCSQPTLPVYDLVDCGPRHRFVVRGHAGAMPFIAHNCENVTQAEAASVLRWANRELDDNGWPLIGHTHDEPLLEVDEHEDEECKAALYDIMTHPPVWAGGLPLRAEVSSGFVYGK